VFACPRAEAIGAPLAWFIPERFRPGHALYLKKFAESGATARRMGATARIVTGLRRTAVSSGASGGEEFPIEASISQTSETRRPTHFFEK
jgi:two-component system sensor kinase